jgi:hypothetical protein
MLAAPLVPLGQILFLRAAQKYLILFIAVIISRLWDSSAGLVSIALGFFIHLLLILTAVSSSHDCI